MAKTLKRTVYVGGVALAPGTELTDDQAEQITNPNATEDRAIPGQDGRKVEGGDEPRQANRDAAEGEGQARKAAPAKAQR